jgi:hypothetical protein
LRRQQRHHGVEVALQPLTILAAGACGQLVPPAGKDERAQQQRFHPRRENRSARLDGELAVAQLMGLMPTSA